MLCAGRYLCAIALAVASLTAAPAVSLAATQDLVVLDSGHLGLIRVDEATGAQASVTTGGLLIAPTGVVVGPDGSVFVSDRGAPDQPGSVVRINPSTGRQTVLASAGLLVDPSGIAVAADGSLLVSDQSSPGSGGVIRVDSTTGAQNAVSSGGLLVDPIAIATGSDGAAYVVDRQAFEKAGGVIRIEPNGGAQSEVTSGGQLRRPTAALMLPGGPLVVADKHTPQPKGVLLNVSGGSQSIFAAGNLLHDPAGLLSIAAGEILVADTEAYSGEGGITRVIVSTGAQSKLASGGLLADPIGLAYATFTDAIPAAPDLGRTVNVQLMSGVVRVAVRRGKRLGRFKRLRGTQQLPVGSAIDATRGRLQLTSSTGDALQSAEFFGGAFSVSQRRRAGGLTELRLRGRPRCATRARVRQSRRRTTRLWGDGKGRFKTRGRNSAATVRGTRWLVEERCSGTFTRVARGVVSVRDRRRGKTVTLRRGDTYLARRSAR